MCGDRCFCCFRCCGCCCAGGEAPLVVTGECCSVSDSTRRLLVFVNPKSGAGKGAFVFKHKIFPALTEQAIGFDSEFSGHAATIVATREDLLDFDAICVLSVHSFHSFLLFWVLNALLKRPDAAHLLLRVPFAVVPCGSGNGLLSSSIFCPLRSLVCFRLPIGNDVFVSTAVHALANPKAVSLPVNLIKIQTPGRTVGSFLSIGWGLLAEIDIESESLRTICGGNRFFWGALWRVAFLRSYRARLSFLEAPPDLPPEAADERSVYGERSIRKQPGKKEALEEADPWEPRVHFDVPGLEQPIPADWTTIEGEFVAVYALSTSHISNVNIYAADSQLNEQQIHLTFILKHEIPSRAAVVKFLTAIETHQHLELPICHYKKVRAFRLEPLDEHKRSPFVVDGELIPDVAGPQKLQAVVSSLCMRVLTE
ncbi:DAGKc domain-containing protein [Aphelenchoides fujianensis]|nr:DAGKc domain-containing protein [Aphelenchoides fujianensis]